MKPEWLEGMHPEMLVASSRRRELKPPVPTPLLLPPHVASSRRRELKLLAPDVPEHALAVASSRRRELKPPDAEACGLAE